MEEVDLLALGKQSVHSVIALISRTFVLQLISAGAFLLISSILLPADIGIYTAVIAIQRIISFFTDFGLGAALVQKRSALTKEDLETSFTIQAGVTFAIFLIIFALNNTIAAYFKLNIQGQHLLLALVFTIFLSSFKTIPSILLERNIKFQKLVIPQIAESLVFNVVLVLLVLQGFKVDGYTYAFLISAIVGIPFYYYVSPWKIGVGLHRQSLHHLKFGAQFQAKNILATVKDDLVTVILIKFLPFAQIGYIGFAQRLAFLAYRYVVDSVTKVTFSTYARIQENKQVLQKAIEKSLFYVSSIMFPLLSGLALISPYVITYFPKWHNKWEPAVVSLVFFCLNAMVSSLSGILVNILDATGRVKITLSLMVLWTTLTWILTPLLIFRFGYNGVAMASFLVTLTVFYTIYLVKKFVDFNFFRSIYLPLLCTILMDIVVYVSTRSFVTNFLTLFVAVAIGGVIYLGSFYLLARNELHESISVILKKHV